jgi:hypothetical protein
MRFESRVIGTIAVAACLTLGAAVAAQTQTSGAKPVIPDTASTLEGVPTVRVDTTKEGAKRRQLSGEEAAQSALKIKVVDGKYYWESRGNRPLTVTSSGEYTYLATEPGQYVRLRKLDDKIEYLEHVDKAWESVTFWGELRIVLKGKK